MHQRIVMVSSIFRLLRTCGPEHLALPVPRVPVGVSVMHLSCRMLKGQNKQGSLQLNRQLKIALKLWRSKLRKMGSLRYAAQSLVAG